MKLFKYPLPLLGLTILLVACAAPPPAPEPPEEPPPPASVIVTTTPADASIRLGNRRPASGDTTSLAAGAYDLVVERSGYLPDRRRIRLSPGQALSLQVDLEQEPPSQATIRVNVNPADASIRIGRHRPGDGETVTMDPGSHELVVERDGYFSHSQRLQLSAGDLRSIDVNLEAIPTAGGLSIQAHHADAVILFDGREVGTGTATLNGIEFGRYQVISRRPLDSWRREHAERNIVFEREGRNRFVLDHATEQWRWQGEWMDASRARSLEQQAYRQARVADPVTLIVEMSSSSLASLTEHDRAADWLFSLLRPGDRIELRANNNRWLLWRRGNQPGPAFQETISAIRAGQRYELPWSARDDQPLNVSTTIDRPATLAFALAAARGQSPLVDLPAEALTALPTAELTFNRARDDGPVLLVAEGGQSLRLGDTELEPDHHNIHRLSLSSGNHQQTLSWRRPPERLLLMPDRGPTLSGPSQEELLASEKRLVPIDMNQRPVRVMQYTFGPEVERTGVWDEFSAAGGPGQALDLRELEIGPNRTDGHYQRVWLLIYDSASGRTQRQVSARYYIGVERLETRGEGFLRRHTREERDGG
ncbi:MAG: carboxypeptidase regulatory-like domain-containing protein [Wenzhouxiangella sp.]